MSDWISKEALIDGPKMPLPLPQKSLSDISEKRQVSPPPRPASTTGASPQAAPEPMSDKELASLLESSGKSLLDAKLAIEKAYVSVSKVGAMSGPSAKDKEYSSKSKAYAAEAKKIGENIEALSKEIGAYRESLLKPANPWL